MVVLNLLIKPVAIFGIDAAVQNRVGAENYGIYFTLLNFSFLFNILMDFGINNFTTKSVAQYPNAATSYFGKMIGFRFVLFVFYAVISFSIAFVLGWNKQELFLLSFLVLNQFFVTLIAYARSHFGGLLMFKTEALISVLDRALLIIFCGILLYTPLTDQPFRIEWFIWIQTFCYGITFLIAFTLLIRKIGLPKVRHKSLFSYAIVRRSIPYAILILLMMIYTRVDSVMIERLHPNGKEEAGFYAQGFRLLDAFFMFAMIFSNLLFPIFSKMFAEKLPFQSLLSTSGKLLVGGAITIATIAFFHSEMILEWIYRDHVEASAGAFQLLMLSFIGMCTGLIFGTLLTAKGSLRFLNTISALGIVANFTVNFFLIPKYGAYGAALATLITQSFVALIQVIYCTRLFTLPVSTITFLQFGGYIGLSVAINYFIPVENTLYLLGVALLHLLGLFTFKLIDLKSLRQTLLSGDQKEI